MKKWYDTSWFIYIYINIHTTMPWIHHTLAIYFRSDSKHRRFLNSEPVKRRYPWKSHYQPQVVWFAATPNVCSMKEFEWFSDGSSQLMSPPRIPPKQVGFCGLYGMWCHLKGLWIEGEWTAMVRMMKRWFLIMFFWTTNPGWWMMLFLLFAKVF